MSYTAIVDYGVGNLKSITNAMGYLGLDTRITSDEAELERAGSIILPGVGALPILGICLGMQLLFDRGEEGKICEGLRLVSGCVERIPTTCKLPHIGWNSLRFPNPSPLFAGLDEGAYVYFVHSYCGVTADPADVSALTDYGVPVTAAVGRGNVYGCQFHPEKSGEAGLQILKNFGGLNR